MVGVFQLLKFGHIGCCRTEKNVLAVKDLIGFLDFHAFKLFDASSGEIKILKFE